MELCLFYKNVFSIYDNLHCTCEEICVTLLHMLFLNVKFSYSVLKLGYDISFLLNREIWPNKVFPENLVYNTSPTIAI